MLADAVVYSVKGETYCWRDIILSAVRRGDWQAVERRARIGAASVRHADATGVALPTGALEMAARDFRYARDLVTAQSMEEWLTRREIEVPEWTAYLRRELQRARAVADTEDLLARYPVAEEEAIRLTMVDATCGPHLDTWARTLARHSAAHASFATLPPTQEAPSVGHDELDSPHPIPVSVIGSDQLLLHASARRLTAIDESMRAFRAATLTERAVQDYANGRQLDWMRFDCRVLAFPREEMAAEAALLLREDGEGFTGVYQVAHTEPRSARFFLDQIDEPLRDHFLGSRPGDLIGPVRIGAEHVLYQVEEKVLPSIRDKDVRQRAEDAVLGLALDQRVEQHVVWNTGG